MEKHVTEALQNYANGYTCSQAVLCAYADEIGMDKETADKIIEGFGGGFGGMQEVCRDVLNGAKPQPFKCGEKVRIAAEIVNKMMEEIQA